MSNKRYLALLAGASFLNAGLHQASANEAEFVSEPTVIYADQPAPRPVAPIRTASAERPNMGGGFIEFLFGDGQNQGDRYSQQPAYQQQPPYPSQRPLLPPMEPQQSARQPELSEPAHPAFDPRLGIAGLSRAQVHKYAWRVRMGSAKIPT